MQTQITILGVKQYKGLVEGQEFDHTKIIYALPFPRNRADSNIGLDALEAPYGKSENFAQFKGRKFPFNAVADVEMTTKGMDILHIELPKVETPKA
ncbi:rstb protein [Inoviridae sp.]|nr:rstb protein [Inoviridae sp.]